MIENFLAALGLNKAGVIAGALGAGIAALRGDGRPPWQRVINFITGFCAAAWGSGIAVSVFHLPESATFHGALGFALGYIGMTVMDAILAAADAVQKQDWKALIAGLLKKWGGGGS